MNIEDLKSLHLKHHNWQNAFLELSAEMLAAKPGSVVRVTGPSRVGKSDLLREYVSQYYPTDPSSDYLPAIVLDVHNMAAQGRFRTMSLLRDALDAVKHPIYSRDATDDEILYRPKIKSLRITESDITDILIKSLRARKTQALVLDEPQDIIYAVGGKPAAAAIFDSLKSLGKKAEVIFVLVAAYPILEVLDLSPHITGRAKTVHFKRYTASEHDLPHFISVLDAISKHVPIANQTGSLVEWTEHLLSGSLGCVGLLMSWVTSAAARMQVSGEKFLTYKMLLETRLPNDDLRVLENEIIPGEQRLSRRDATSDQPRQGGNSDSPLRSYNSKPGKQRPRRHRKGNRS